MVSVPGIRRGVGEDKEDEDQTKGRQDGVEGNGMAAGRRGNEGGNKKGSECGKKGQRG